MKMLKYFLLILFVLPFMAAAEMPKGGICAHQGDIENFPNNSIPGFKSALKLGAAMIEFDVIQCKTGELMVFHDPAIDKLTDGKGRVREMTFEELRKVKVFHRHRKPGVEPTQIATFQEVLDCIPKDGVWLNVHTHNPETVLKCARILEKEGRLHQAFISTNLNWMKKTRKEVPGIRFCNLSRTGKRNEKWTREQHKKYAAGTVKYGCSFVQPIQYFPQEDVKYLHDNGVKISFFECNDVKKVKEILDNGVDFIFTNNLKRIKDEYDRLKK